MAQYRGRGISARDGCIEYLPQRARARSSVQIVFIVSFACQTLEP
jgi:hypothetical protein